ncbi:MAG TPA: anthranilate phosphoribosyltransferase, partial [Methyloceanibacter sp.]
NWVEPLAEVLNNLGCERAWICHGEGGFDEIVATGRTWVSELKDGKVMSYEITPEDVGLARGKASDLRGGDAAHNAEALLGVLAGAKGAFRDSAAMTAGAALLIAGKARDFTEGVRMAEASIDSGAARKSLEKLVATSHG